MWGILWGPSMPRLPVEQDCNFYKLHVNSAIRALAMHLLSLYSLLRRQMLYPAELRAHGADNWRAAAQMAAQDPQRPTPA